MSFIKIIFPILFLTLLHQSLITYGCSLKYFDDRSSKFNNHHSLRYGMTEPSQLIVDNKGAKTFIVSYSGRNRAPIWAFEVLQPDPHQSNADDREPTQDNTIDKLFRTTKEDYTGGYMPLIPPENHDNDDKLWKLSNFVSKKFFDDENLNVWNEINERVQEISKTKEVLVCTIPIYSETHLVRKKDTIERDVTVHVLNGAKNKPIYVPIALAKVLLYKKDGGTSDQGQGAQPSSSSSIVNSKSKLSMKDYELEIYKVASSEDKLYNKQLGATGSKLDDHVYVGLLDDLEFEAGMYVFERELDRKDLNERRLVNSILDERRKSKKRDHSQSPGTPKKKIPSVSDEL